MKYWYFFSLFFMFQACSKNFKIEEFYKVYALNQQPNDEYCKEIDNHEIAILAHAHGLCNKENISPLAEDFLKVVELYNDIKFEEALSKIDSLVLQLDINILSNRLLLKELEYYKNRIYIYSKEFDKVFIADIQNISKKPFYEKYTILNEWYIRALLHSKRNETHEAFGAIHNALYQIINDSDKKYFEVSYAKFIALKAEILIQEDKKYLDLGVKLAKQAISIFNKYKVYNEELIASCNLTSMYYLKNDIFSLKQARINLEKFNNLSRLGAFYQAVNIIGNPDGNSIIKYLDFIKTTSKYLEDCTYFRLVANTQLISHQKNSLIKESDIDFFEIPEDCGKIKHLLSKFYLIDNKLALSYLKPEKKIKLLLEKRGLAEDLFPNKETFHLDDFYTTNTTDVLNVLNDNKYLLNDIFYKKLVIELFSNTKARGLDIEMYNDLVLETIITSGDNVKIEKTISKINDFLDENLNKVEYFEIYNLLLKKKAKAETVLFRSNSDSIKINRVLDEDDNNVLVDFIYNSKDSFYYYNLVSKGNVEVGKIHFTSINFIKNIRKDGFLKELNSSHLDFYRLFSMLKQYQSISIIPDNEIAFIPFDLIKELFGRVKLYPTISSFLENTEFHINRTSSVVFSYSDENTLASKDSLSLPELKYSYKEGMFLRDLLKSKFIHGESFSKNAFFNNLPTKILHVSSHAESSEKRQDCFFYTRSRNDLEKLFGYELLKTRNLADFVNLSGCNTAKGMQVSGQGIYALPRYFFGAGAKSIIQTLWQIDDKRAYEFNKLFYTYWLEGNNCGEAVTKAKISLKRLNPYDSDWAAFTLVGNPNIYLN